MSTASIQIDPVRSKHAIDPRIYSGFTEHMGRCIYGGIYEEGSPLSDENGFRQDVMNALKEINPPLVRWPGGNFCAQYVWTDGIGPLDQRPRTVELAWLGEEPNRFGTDEFMKWCDQLGTEPFICLNMGTGTLEAALHWLEYMNGSGNTYWANKRRENGHPEPYGVKYVALGNEIWGPWQVAQECASDYAKKARQWAKALKLLDPKIKLVACGKEGFGGDPDEKGENWEAIIMPELVDMVDFVSLHLYTRGLGPHFHEVSCMTPAEAEVAIKNTERIIEMAMIEKKCTNRPGICFDEWQSWDPETAVGSNGAEQEYTMTDALALSAYLNVFIRTGIPIACLAQSVNVISPLMTSPKGILKQTSWYALEMFARFMHGAALDIAVISPKWDALANGGTPDRPWAAFVCKDAFTWIDATASIDESKGTLNVMLINRHAKDGFDVTLNFASANVLAGGKEVSVTELYHKDVKAVNTWDKPDTVLPVESKVTLKDDGVFKVKPCSLTLIRIPYKT